jgi:hypothetical protein
MVAQNTDEIIRELDRTQGAPVQFEHPRTHARYVVISEDAYLQALPILESSLQVTSPTPVEWTEAKNARRFDLIKRKYSAGITHEEESELTILQNEMSAYRARVAPLPLEMLEAAGREFEAGGSWAVVSCEEGARGVGGVY